jgi:hypothetical protein
MIAYSKLKEELNNFDVKYSEDSLPNIDNEADINIFISHGGRESLKGFKGIYPSVDKVYTDDNIFGKGKVAILFVCHSGSIVDNHYSNSFHTLIKVLLKSGYQAVIAPSWSLNICIPGIWTKELLEKLKDGNSLSSAVYYANKKVNSIYMVESACAAMHLFGNPHLSVNG